MAIVTHRKRSGAAANPKVLLDGPAWDDSHVGLENVDNTSDLNKPVSTATAAYVLANGSASSRIFDYLNFS